LKQPYAKAANGLDVKTVIDVEHLTAVWSKMTKQFFPMPTAALSKPILSRTAITAFKSQNAM
jgi:hypothetical protein